MPDARTVVSGSSPTAVGVVWKSGATTIYPFGERAQAQKMIEAFSGRRTLKDTEAGGYFSKTYYVKALLLGPSGMSEELIGCVDLDEVAGMCCVYETAPMPQRQQAANAP